MAAWRAALSTRLRTTRDRASASPATGPADTPEASTVAASSPAAAGPRPARCRRGRRAGALVTRAPSSARLKHQQVVDQRLEPEGLRQHGRRPGLRAVARSGWALATSACWRMAAIGDRSSCDASATNRRCRSWADCRPSSMRFTVAARRATSSSVAGWGTRRPRSSGDTASAAARMASTGASARPTTAHVVTRHDHQQGRDAADQRPADDARRLVDRLQGAGHHHAARPAVGHLGRDREEPLAVVRQLHDGLAPGLQARGERHRALGALLVACRLTRLGVVVVGDGGALGDDRAVGVEHLGHGVVLGAADQAGGPAGGHHLGRGLGLLAGRPGDPVGQCHPQGDHQRDARGHQGQRHDQRGDGGRAHPHGAQPRGAGPPQPAPAGAVGAIGAGSSGGRRRTPASSGVRRQPAVGRQPVAPRRRGASRSPLGRRAGRPCCAAAGRRPRRCSGRPRTRRPTRGRGPRACDTACPWRRIRYSSTASSRAVSSTSWPPRHTRRSARSTRRSPASSATGRSAGSRRISAREPGHEHGVRERLGEEVVGAGVEGLDLVPLAVLGGEDQDRRPHALGPQRGADPEAAHPRQHQVEDDGVVAALPGTPQPVGPVPGDVDGEALGLQARPQALGQALLVLDHEHPHAEDVTNPAPRRSPCPSARVQDPPVRRCHTAPAHSPDDVRPAVPALPPRPPPSGPQPPDAYRAPPSASRPWSPPCAPTSAPTPTPSGCRTCSATSPASAEPAGSPAARTQYVPGSVPRTTAWRCHNWRRERARAYAPLDRPA